MKSNGIISIFFLLSTVILICMAIAIDRVGESTAIIIMACCTTGATIHYSLQWFRQWISNAKEFEK